MATLAPAGRINLETVEAETARLQKTWSAGASSTATTAVLESVLGERLAEIDQFDHWQLAQVIDDEPSKIGSFFSNRSNTSLFIA